jgi:hypothetical protein
MLLLKDPSQPVQEANLRGINMPPPHTSKLELVALYAPAYEVCERALGDAAWRGRASTEDQRPGGRGMSED